MHTITATYGELDSETQDYLRDVGKAGGKRCPGIFVEADPRPWGKIAVGVGPLVALGGLILAFNTNKDAYAAAMLLAGTLMLGGWLTWYGIRELTGSSRRFFGHFTYFDPSHVYQVSGSDVTVTDVADARGVRDKGAGVVFTLPDGKLVVPLGRAGKRQLVERYYEALAELEEHRDPKWANLDATELGGVAKHIAVEGGYPISAKSADLRIDALPHDPRKDGGGPPWRLIVPFGGAAVAFVLGILLFKPVRDGSAFAAAKEGGAPGLRGYLMDDRNTANRDEAKRLLAAMYDAPINKVKAVAPPDAPPVAGDQPKVREGFAALLESLRDAPQPVVSIRVTEAGQVDGGTVRENELRTDLADALGLYVGPELIAFVKGPDDKPAHLEVSYTVSPTGAVTWKATVRPTLDGPAFEGAEQPLGGGLQGGKVGLKEAFFQAVFRQGAPVLPPPVFNDDDGW